MSYPVAVLDVKAVERHALSRPRRLALDGQDTTTINSCRRCDLGFGVCRAHRGEPDREGAEDCKWATRA